MKLLKQIEELNNVPLEFKLAHPSTPPLFRIMHYWKYIKAALNVVKFFTNKTADSIIDAAIIAGDEYKKECEEHVEKLIINNSKIES
ncbi:MAG: hypothetical protein IPO86_10045 [Saprospiraceae bacterium]|nr:hypothetical protein [Saprospiraceae bacterium]